MTEAATGARSANDRFPKMDTYPPSMAVERTGGAEARTLARKVSLFSWGMTQKGQS